MRILLPIALAVGLLFPSAAEAAGRRSQDSFREGDLGLGVIVGDPTALGGRYWFSRELAAQVWLGTTYFQRGVRLSFDLLYGIPGIVEASGSTRNKLRFDLAFGGGVSVGTAGRDSGYHCHNDPWRYCHRHDRNSAVLALRGPVSFSVLIHSISLDIFVEAAPSLVLLPFTGFDLDFGLGARYYF